MTIPRAMIDAEKLEGGFLKSQIPDVTFYVSFALKKWSKGGPE